MNCTRHSGHSQEEEETVTSLLGIVWLIPLESLRLCQKLELFVVVAYESTSGLVCEMVEFAGVGSRDYVATLSFVDVVFRRWNSVSIIEWICPIISILFTHIGQFILQNIGAGLFR